MVDRDWLKERLDAGDSITSIALESGKDGSTVSYWVRKFGLHSAHAEVVAYRGGIGREELEALIEAGCSTRQIAEALDRSQSTIRHWLKRYGLSTAIARRRDVEGGDTTSVCKVHGTAPFRRDSNGRWRCLTCRAERVSRRRRKVKQLLIAEAGGACVLCGYDRFQGALQFHHRDPETKVFGIAYEGSARSIERAREEAAKCVLLCANCHAEVEWGDATLPPVSA